MNVCASFDALAIFAAHLEPFRPYQRKVPKIAVVPKGNPNFLAQITKKSLFELEHGPTVPILLFSKFSRNLWTFGRLLAPSPFLWPTGTPFIIFGLHLVKTAFFGVFWLFLASFHGGKKIILHTGLKHGPTVPIWLFSDFSRKVWTFARLLAPSPFFWPTGTPLVEFCLHLVKMSDFGALRCYKKIMLEFFFENGP